MPFRWFLGTFRWAIHLLDRISGAIVKALGVTSAQVHGVAHSTEELQIQIQQARERGLIAPGEEKFILSAMELAQIQVREIMVPRPDIHTLPVEASLDEVMRVFATTQRSRIPVYRGDLDHILGFCFRQTGIGGCCIDQPPINVEKRLPTLVIVGFLEPADEAFPGRLRILKLQAFKLLQRSFHTGLRRRPCPLDTGISNSAEEAFSA